MEIRDSNGAYANYNDFGIVGPMKFEHPETITTGRGPFSMWYIMPEYYAASETTLSGEGTSTYRMSLSAEPLQRLQDAGNTQNGLRSIIESISTVHTPTKI